MKHHRCGELSCWWERWQFSVTGAQCPAARGGPVLMRIAGRYCMHVFIATPGQGNVASFMQPVLRHVWEVPGFGTMGAHMVHSRSSSASREKG